ncbi:MAG: PQQ-binding-like beta-propeller repeat protein [Planctomycetota bacterium]
MKRFTCAAALGAAIALAAASLAADWTNSGGNPAHDGLTSELGPDAADLLWSGGRPSIIAWQPLIEGARVFMVRQTGFPPGGEPNGSPVVCMDLDTGRELWATNIPFDPNDWTTWVGGAKNGKVYAARSGNGASVWAKLYCLDAATGGVVWSSRDLISTGAYEGLIFAPNGDPIACSFRDIWRISHVDGTTAWHATRTGSVSGNCAGAVYGDAVYVVDAAAGGNVVVRFDLNTGARMYESSVMAGFTIQNGLLAGRDGTVYVCRTQNNAAVDHFYAFADSGAALTEKWRVPSRWCTSAEFAVGPDGSVYMVAPGNIVSRLDPATGATLNTSAPIVTETNLTVRMACDRQGRLYLSNGAFGSGRFYSFTADLTPRWDVAVQNINIGGPAIGLDGTLVICGVGTDVRAYRTERLHPGDLNCDGAVNFDDINPFVLALSDPTAYALLYPNCNILNGDCNGDGLVNFDDINPFVRLLTGVE